MSSSARDSLRPVWRRTPFQGGCDDRIGASGRHRRPFGVHDHPQEPGTRFDSGPAPGRGCPGGAPRRFGRAVAAVRPRRRSSCSWDDDESIDRFLADHPLAAKLSSGWHVRLEPLPRVRDLARLPTRGRFRSSATSITTARSRRSRWAGCARVRRFASCASSKAENSAVTAPGLSGPPGWRGCRRSSRRSRCGRRRARCRPSCTARRPGASRRDRTRRGETVPPPAGIHPLPAVRRARRGSTGKNPLSVLVPG